MTGISPQAQRLVKALRGIGLTRSAFKVKTESKIVRSGGDRYREYGEAVAHFDTPQATDHARARAQELADQGFTISDFRMACGHSLVFMVDTRPNEGGRCAPTIVDGSCGDCERARLEAQPAPGVVSFHHLEHPQTYATVRWDVLADNPALPPAEIVLEGGDGGEQMWKLRRVASEDRAQIMTARVTPGAHLDDVIALLKRAYPGATELRQHTGPYAVLHTYIRDVWFTVDPIHEARDVEPGQARSSRWLVHPDAGPAMEITAKNGQWRLYPRGMEEGEVHAEYLLGAWLSGRPVDPTMEQINDAARAEPAPQVTVRAMTDEHLRDVRALLEERFPRARVRQLAPRLVY